MAADGCSSFWNASLSELKNKMGKEFPNESFLDLQNKMKEQFQYILPTYFEVTEETRRLASLPGDGPDKRYQYARVLVACADPSRRRSRDIHIRDLESTRYITVRYSRALEYYGLDFLGGNSRFNDVLYAALLQHRPLMNIEIFVVCPEKAKGYVNLGTKVIPETAMLKEPANLNAALANYELINRLVTICPRKGPQPKAYWEYLREDNKGIHEWIHMRNAFRQYVLQLHENQVVERIISHHAKY